MKILLLAGCLMWCAAATLQAEGTSLTQELVEQKEITIACELTQAPKPSEALVISSAKECENTKGTYHYKLWLPAGYLADPKKRWPCLFIASFGGNARMGDFAPWLKENGYIVVMLVESKNGPWEPIIGNFLAAHDDVVKRVRIQEGLKIATGFSGGSRASTLFVQMRPGFSGLIMQGAGGPQDGKGKYLMDGVKRNQSLYVAMAVGNKDGNRKEIPVIKALLPSSRFLALSFEGGHASAPAEIFEKAITWIQNQNKPRLPGSR